MSLPKAAFILSMLFAISQASVVELSPQEKLLEKFFGKSRRMGEVIPKINQTDNKPITLHTGIIISHIYDIKSNEEEIDLGIWISFQWKNQLVQWNTSEYAVNRLEVDLDKLWIPKIFLVQNAIAQPLIPSNRMGTAIVYPDGHTTLDFAVMIKLTCNMPACLFPADEHACPLIFNSISYDNRDIKMVYNTEIDKAYGQFTKSETGLWKIIRSNVTEINFPASVGPESKPTNSSALYMILKFVRKPGYYWLTVVSPMVLICIVTFCSVLLPWESGERTSLLITCFLALIVYLDTILGSVPKTSDYVPVIVFFVILVLIFTIMQITFTALASYYAERASRGKGFITPYERIWKCIKKIFFEKKKKSSIKSFELNTFVDDEIEIERKFPPAVQRQVSRDVPDGNMPSVTFDKARKVSRINSFSGIQENASNDDNIGDFGSEDKGAADDPSNACKGKECRKACKMIDRISSALSLILVIACPTMFHLMYSGKISWKCGA
ncbi:neuronal acetylcholine receptor subunit beta-3-like [Rhopilema esculentum]|uniref:neuronal acetylcholine receptor subunit beta-3-like n=1 Tax=Rhopilema esculentum TaxID=499914 RepID=UPI0031D67BD3